MAADDRLIRRTSIGTAAEDGRAEGRRYTPETSIGAIAQLGERLPRTEEVRGSTPLRSTTLRSKHTGVSFRRRSAGAECRSDSSSAWFANTAFTCRLGKCVP